MTNLNSKIFSFPNHINESTDVNSTNHWFSSTLDPFQEIIKSKKEMLENLEIIMICFCLVQFLSFLAFYMRKGHILRMEENRRNQSLLPSSDVQSSTINFSSQVPNQLMFLQDHLKFQIKLMFLQDHLKWKLKCHQ